MGGMAAYAVSRDKFESVGKVIMQMNVQQKQLLFEESMKIIRSFSIQDVMTLQSTITGNMLLRRQLLDRVVDHVHNQLEMKIID